MKESKEYMRELESFIEKSSAGEIIFEKKPNGDILISKRETRLIKNR